MVSDRKGDQGFSRILHDNAVSWPFGRGIAHEPTGMKRRPSGRPGSSRFGIGWEVGKPARVRRARDHRDRLEIRSRVPTKDCLSKPRKRQAPADVRRAERHPSHGEPSRPQEPNCLPPGSDPANDTAGINPAYGESGNRESDRSPGSPLVAELPSPQSTGFGELKVLEHAEPITLLQPYSFGDRTTLCAPPRVGTIFSFFAVGEILENTTPTPDTLAPHSADKFGRAGTPTPRNWPGAAPRPGP